MNKKENNANVSTNTQVHMSSRDIKIILHKAYKEGKETKGNGNNKKVK